jgi:hypothetical protein
MLRKTLAAAVVAAALAGTTATAATAASGWKTCGNRIGYRVQANRATSCSLALKVGSHPATDFYDGLRVKVRSPVTGRTYSFHLASSYRGVWEVWAPGGHGTVLKVRLTHLGAHGS